MTYDPMFDPTPEERGSEPTRYAQVYEAADGWHYVIKDPAVDPPGRSAKEKEVAPHVGHHAVSSSRKAYGSEEEVRKAVAKAHEGLLIERVGAP